MRNFKTTRNLIVIAVVLCGTGYFRIPKEQKFMEDLRERKIAHPKLIQKYGVKWDRPVWREPSVVCAL